MERMKIQFEEKPNDKRFKDIEGQKFNRLLVIGYYGKIGKQQYWWVECDCGTIKRIQAGELKAGNTKSCGCYHIERSTIHRLRNSLEYRSFESAKARCENPNNDAYNEYGGRGIRFLYKSVDELVEDIGKRPSEEYSLERINTNANYEKGNVKWATRTEQQRNRRINHLITINEETKCLTEWANNYNIDAQTVFRRINKYNWCKVCALTIKPHEGKCNHR